MSCVIPPEKWMGVEITRDGKPDRFLLPPSVEEISRGIKMVGMFWVVPPPHNSHHQAYYISSRGSL